MSLNKIISHHIGNILYLCIDKKSPIKVYWWNKKSPLKM